MDELEFDGVRYVAAKRAARENGYTSDYLGQLIRGGKLTGRKVGRAWYVEEASLNTYLAGTGEKKTESSVAEPEVQPEPVADVAPEIETLAVQIPVRVIEEKPTPSFIAQKEPKAVSKDYALLTYFADSEPVIPDLQMSQSSSRAVPIQTPVPDEKEVVKAAAVPETPPEFYEKLITEDIPKRHKGERRSLLPTPSALLAGIALALLLTSGSIALISQELSYEGGDVSSSYAIQYRGVDLTESVAGVFLSISELRLAE